MIPVFISPEGEILSRDKQPSTPSEPVPATEPVNMEELIRTAEAEARKASTRP
jgi:hypothetical protein